MNTVFYIASAVAILSTIMVITRTNAVHALLYLILSLLSVAVIFFVAGAPFVAALEIIIYAGAIMVLFTFVVMMLNTGEKAINQERKWLTSTIWLGPGVLSLILLGLYMLVITSSPPTPMDAEIVSPKFVGVSLFSKYLLGVEIAAMLLMAAIIGAYHLGKQKKKVVHRFLEDTND
jgi:NADH-quinone oxidoreductase subunit J